MAWREDGRREEVGVVSRHRVDKVEQGALTVMEALPVSRYEGPGERGHEFIILGAS